MNLGYGERRRECVHIFMCAVRGCLQPRMYDMNSNHVSLRSCSHHPPSDNKCREERSSISQHFPSPWADCRRPDDSDGLHTDPRGETPGGDPGKPLHTPSFHALSPPQGRPFILPTHPALELPRGSAAAHFCVKLQLTARSTTHILTLTHTHAGPFQPAAAVPSQQSSPLAAGLLLLPGARLRARV
jgi:hypothetical protein